MMYAGNSRTWKTMSRYNYDLFLKNQAIKMSYVPAHAIACAWHSVCACAGVFSVPCASASEKFVTFRTCSDACSYAEIWLTTPLHYSGVDFFAIRDEKENLPKRPIYGLLDL